MKRIGSLKVILAGSILFILYFKDNVYDLILLSVFILPAGIVHIKRRSLNRKIDLNQHGNINSLLKAYKNKPTDFEYYVADVFKRSGYNVKVTRASHDGGIDILLEKGNKKYAAEVKLYNPDHKVSEDLIKKLFASCYDVKRAGIFITTSSYTEGAVNYATNHNIRLIDGKILEKMI